LVAAENEEDGGGCSYQNGEGGYGNGDTSKFERGGGATDHARDLRDEAEIHREPDPDHPRDEHAGAGQSVERFQCSASAGDGVAAEFDLDENFEHAAENNEPKELESFLRAELGSDDQFARTNNDGADDQAGAELAEGAEEIAGSQF
jgi:hypothetical protein